MIVSGNNSIEQNEPLESGLIAPQTWVLVGTAELLPITGRPTCEPKRIERDLRLRGGGKFDEKNMLLVIEHCLQGGLDQILGGEINAQRINVLLILVKLEMQMRTGRSAGGTNVANDLSFGDSCAVSDPFGKPIEMGVAGCVFGIVLDFNHFSVETVPVCHRNNTIADRPDRGTSLGSEVYPRMRNINLQDRVKARVSKMRSDVGKLQRESEKGSG